MPKFIDIPVLWRKDQEDTVDYEGMGLPVPEWDQPEYEDGSTCLNIDHIVSFNTKSDGNTLIYMIDGDYYVSTLTKEELLNRIEQCQYSTINAPTKNVVLRRLTRLFSTLKENLKR